MYYKTAWKESVPLWQRDIAVVILLICQQFATGLYGGAEEEVTGYFGGASEFISLTGHANAIGLTVMLPIYYRLRRFFVKKQLLLIGLTGEIGLNLFSSTAPHPAFLLVANFLFGACKCICLLDLIGVFMRRFNPENSRGKFYGLYYTLSRSVQLPVQFLLAWLLLEYNWKATYLASFPALLISVMLVLLVFHSGRTERKVQLYQVDWPGALLFTSASFSLGFFCIYGGRLEWFSSPAISRALLIFTLSFGAFVYRELTVKRPFLNLRLLGRYYQIRTGVIFMIILFFFYTGNGIVREYEINVLKLYPLYQEKLNLFMLIPYLIGFPAAGWWLHQHRPARTMLILGFGFYALQFISLYLLTVSYLSWTMLIVPLMAGGFGYALALTTLSYFMSTGIPPDFNGHRAFYSIASRFVFGSLAGTGIFSRWISESSSSAKIRISEQLSAPAFRQSLQQLKAYLETKGMAPEAANKEALKVLSAKLQSEAFLEAARDVYLYLFIFALIAIALLIMLPKLDMHQVKRYRYPLVDL